jgi:large subunit ribosomal protein L29
MKTKELRLMPVEDLKELLAKRRRELRELRFNLSAGKVKNIRELHNVKKDVARIETILREVALVKK